MELYQDCKNSDEPNQLPPLMLAHNAESALDFMCGTVCRIKSSQLEETLLVLPLDIVKNLMDIMLELLSNKMEVETVSRCLLFLLEIHHGPILANKVIFYLGIHKSKTTKNHFCWLFAICRFKRMDKRLKQNCNFTLLKWGGWVLPIWIHFGILASIFEESEWNFAYGHHVFSFN